MTCGSIYYIYNHYAKDGITPGEVDGILLRLYKLLCDGFILNRENRDTEGFICGQLRIPDGIVFVNVIPLLEFKSAVIWFQNKLRHEGRYTDAVDECYPDFLLLKT